MNKYLIEVTRFFSGKETFEVEAENKQDALEKARKKIYRNDNYLSNSVKVVKKLRK